MNKDLSKTKNPVFRIYEGRELRSEEKSEAVLRVLDLFENQEGVWYVWLRVS